MSVGYAIGPGEEEILQLTNQENPYGLDYNFSSGGETSGSGTAWVTIGQLIVPNADSLNLYSLKVSLLWGLNSGNVDFQTRLLVNGQDVLVSDAFSMRQEPKDAAGTGTGGTDQRHPAKMMENFGLNSESFTSGPLDFELQSRATGNTAWVASSVNLEWKRVK